MTSTGSLARNIAGEIAIASEPGVAIKKWREIFQIHQGELAKSMNISPSVISDYESGRRKSPGTHFIKHLVESIIQIDDDSGWETIRRFTVEQHHEAITSIKEFTTPISGWKVMDRVDGEIVGRKKAKDIWIKGYTVIDSIKAIVELSEETLRDI